jgi:hypothetical protein
MTVSLDESKAAPHGRDDSGTPLAPYGLNLDGSPRKSNRGARPGQRQGGRGRPKSPGVKTTSKTDRQRKETLLGLADMFLVTPLAAASASPQVEKRFGPRQCAALAGDAVLLANYGPGLADGLIELSQTKPAVLSWLDSVEEKAPWIMLASVGLQLTKAVVENHLNPNPELANAGRVMLQMKSQQMVDAINAEARAMGIPTDTEPTVRFEDESAA